MTRWTDENEPLDRVPTDDAPPAPLWLKAFLAIVACALAYWFLTWGNV
jgi:hypothetical protein